MKYVHSKYTTWEYEVLQTIVTGYHVKTRWCELLPCGLLGVHAGYPWDGATGGIDTEDFVLPSLEHDVLCELVNQGLLPEYEQCKVDEQLRRRQKDQQHRMPWLRRQITYFGVRFFQMHKRPGVSRKVYEVH